MTVNNANIQRFENLKQIVVKQEQDFNKLAKIHGAVHFEREASFAVQILQDSTRLADIAYDNPDSLKRAVVNVAAIGLSLSPVHKLAYLVPRDKKVCLDISYQGLVKLATDIGAIEWAAAEIVKEKDTFVYKGVDEKPLHEFEAFKDRGEIVGAYCLAKLSNGYMVTLMSISEIYSIRDRSPAAAAKTGPWKTDESEMIKKTVIKRASKSWPKTSIHQDRFETALDVSNSTDEVIFDAGTKEADDTQRMADLATIDEGIAFLERDEKKFLEYCTKVHKREIKEVHEMTDIELSQTASYIRQLVEKQKEVPDAAS